MLVKNQMYGELLGDVEAVDDAAEEAAAACLKGRRWRTRSPRWPR